MFKRFLLDIRRNFFWKNVFLLSSGTFFSQLLTLLSVPIVSRLYIPNDFGIYAIVLTISTLIFNIANLGLNSSIMNTKNRIQTDKLFSLVFFLGVFISLFLLIIFYLSNFFGLNSFKNLTYVLLYSLSLQLKSILVVYSNKKKLYKTIFFNTLISSLSTIIFTIPFGLLGFGSDGLIIASILSNIFSIFQMVFKIRPKFYFLGFKDIKLILNANLSFIIYLYPSNFIESFSKQIPVIILSTNFSTQNIGSYLMIEKLLGIPSRLIGAPINQVYYRLATDLQSKKDKLAKITFSLISTIMTFGFILFLLLSFFGSQIFTYVLGNQWFDAGKVSPFLFASYIFLLSSMTTSYCRVALGRQKLTFYLSIVKLIPFILLFLFSSRLNFFDFILVFSFITIFVEIIDMLSNFFVLNKFFFKYLILVTLYLMGIFFVLKISNSI